MSDRASFRASDIEDVWIRPSCVFTLSRECDGHHILGRGYSHGFGTSKDERAWFSSIYNFIPISRAIHNGPLRDCVEARMLFLRLAREKVSEAECCGRYVRSDLDESFLIFSEKWIKENHERYV